MNQHSNENRDVRMRGFTARATVAAALRWVDAATSPLEAECVGLGEAAGRILAEPISSATDVPRFRRAMMDGFAVRAENTYGASPYNPLRLRCDGLVLPGRPPAHVVPDRGSVKIMTGAALPQGANAVLPAEFARLEAAAPDAATDAAETLVCLGEVSPGKHVGLPGEDIRQGEQVLESGRWLRPQDLGVLSSIGQDQAPVIRKPRVRIVVTGDELVPPGRQPAAAQIADANSPMLQALIQRDGGSVVNPGIVADEPEAIAHALQDDADVILVSGGSSVGQEDHAPTLVAKLGDLAIHGIAIRPSSPAGMGRIGERCVFLLPGNPVSCLCAYDMFAGRAIRRLAGLPSRWPYASARLPLKRKLVSQIGRVDYARVRIVGGEVEPLAISGASILSSTTRADGFVLIDENSEGFAAGAAVQVWLYDPTSAFPVRDQGDMDGTPETIS